MKCPACSSLDSRVVDSRTTKEGVSIRRRRECESCRHRFTTYERPEVTWPLIVKKDGERVPYDREKIYGERRAIVGHEIDCTSDSIIS